MIQTASLIREMVHYFEGDPGRIQHFMKVHDFARTIGILEALPADQLFVLETAAIVHDIGIKVSESKYGDADGKHQEQEGPAAARPILEALRYDAAIIDRVCYLIAHHHTYTNMDGMDYRILVEADFLVNLYEGHSAPEACRKAMDTVFCTKAGRQLCADMFGI